MAEFKRNPEPERPPAKISAAESGSMLALLIGCIAVLFIIGIRLAYDHAEETASVAANPPALVGSPATQNANASSPAETTGSGAQTETTGSAATPKGGSSNRNSGAAPKDQSFNQNGDPMPASAQHK